MVFILPNQPNLIDETPVDRAIETVLGLASARTTEEVGAEAKRLGPAAIRAIYDWASVHAESDVGADIRWLRRQDVRASVAVQVPQWEELRRVIEASGDAKVEQVTLSAMLVRYDSENRSFRLAFEEAEHISGHLDEALALAEPVRVPARYTVRLKKTTVRRYSTDQDTVTWVLEDLTLMAQPVQFLSEELKDT
jgi:hypothetical protein